MAGELTLSAPAKLNLCLRVGPPREDGFHPVATMMVALDGLHDTVTVTRAHRREVRCPGMDGDANLAWRALDALERAAGRPLPPLRVDIVKRIPAQAGLGGGSSDAAATMRAARAVLDLPLDDDHLRSAAATVGSDVPFFIRGGTAWALGRGEVLRPLAPPEHLWAVVVPPAAHLSTAAVYRAFDRMGRPAAVPDTPPTSPWHDGTWVQNDLWPAALACAPRLGAEARRLTALAPLRVLLCGSGGALAALFDDAAAARHAAARLPTAWVCAPAAPVGEFGGF